MSNDIQKLIGNAVCSTALTMLETREHVLYLGKREGLRNAVLGGTTPYEKPTQSPVAWGISI